MDIKAKLLSSNKGVLVFETQDYAPYEQGEYRLTVKPYRTSRSLESNSKLWAIIQEIAEETQNEPMDIYIAALENANAKYEWIAGLPEIEEGLKRIFRAVKPYGTVTTEDNKELIRYKVWIGSSKFDTKEMSLLIDYVTQLAYSLGLQV